MVLSNTQVNKKNRHISPIKTMYEVYNKNNKNPLIYFGLHPDWSPFLFQKSRAAKPLVEHHISTTRWDMVFLYQEGMLRCLHKLSSLYDELPVEILARFYYEIKKNIRKRILSNAMYFELNLIEKAAQDKGVAAQELHRYLFIQ